MAFNKLVDTPSSQPTAEPPVPDKEPLHVPFSCRKFEKVYQMALLYLQGKLPVPENYRYSNMSFILEMETAIEMALNDCPHLIAAMQKKLDKIRPFLIAPVERRTVQ